MRYLLDTNILSDLIRNPQGRIARKIEEVGENAVSTSVIVAAELRYGAEKKRLHRLTSQVDAVLGALDVLPFDAPSDRIYGLLRTRLESKGIPIGANDLLIAAHAMSLNLALVTDNLKEFSRIVDLTCENWLAG